MRKALSLVLPLLFAACGHAFSSPITAEDFLPPVQASTPEARKAAGNIQRPEDVRQEAGIDEKPAVAAASAQDGVNAAIQRIPASGGCEQFKFPSGFGWVATGSDIYTVHANPVTTLTVQRLAYQKAYLAAKRNLAQALYGLSTAGRDQLAQEIRTVLTDADALANTSETLSENISEQISGLLRGYVIYSINDDQKDGHGVVTVSIVTTPKTMGRLNRVDTASLKAESVKEGLNAVLAEVSAGLVPPVGGKTISVGETGELAFVGFGTAVILNNENPAVQAKLTLDAQKIAAMRARSALCGMILGDEVTARATLDATTQSMSAQFEELQKDDPVNREKDDAAIRKLESQKTGFLATQVSKEEIASMRRGVLPPGVTVRTFFNESKTVVEAVAVYMPSVAANAAKAAQDMKGSAVAPGGSQRGAMPQRGASGQVSQDADL